MKNSTNYVLKTSRNYYQVFDVIVNYELGRMITPYAKFFPKDFKYTYVFDVTDFASKLKDSVQIRMDYSGYSFGFTCTVNFEFIDLILELYFVIHKYFNHRYLLMNIIQ